MYDNLNTKDRVYLIYCDMGAYRRWVKQALTAESFFSNYDKLVSALKELTTIEYDYYDPKPADELKELIDNEQQYYLDFLSRSWVNIVAEAAKLKTDRGRTKKIQTFFDSIEPFRCRLSQEALQLIEKAKTEQPDFTLTKPSRSDRDEQFLLNTSIELDKQNTAYLNAANSSEHIAFFINNSYLLSNILKEDIDQDVIFDVSRMLLAGYENRKSVRYLKLKYSFSNNHAEKIFLTASRIVYNYRRMQELKMLGYDEYTISTNGIPCEKCQAMGGKVYPFKDAQIGKNFPPLCPYGCSIPLMHRPEDEVKTVKLSYPDKLFAKAMIAQYDDDDELAAEYGSETCRLVPESSRYIQTVPDMLAKVGRYQEAVKLLDEYAKLTGDITYNNKRDRYAKKIM